MLSEDQKNKIETILTTQFWDHIYDTVLTEEQKQNPKTMKSIAFDMEDILQKVAAGFGLSGMS